MYGLQFVLIGGLIKFETVNASERKEDDEVEQEKVYFVGITFASL